MPTTTTTPTATKTTASQHGQGAKPPKPLPAPTVTFTISTKPCRRRSWRSSARTRIRGNKVAPVINDYWVKDQFPSATAGSKELGIGGWPLRAMAARRKAGVVRLRPNGARTHRPVVLDLVGVHYRTGDGLYIYRWVGRAETEVAPPMARFDKSAASVYRPL